MSDVKVLNGNNRQFDILAYNVKKGKQYHVEVSVMHDEQWASTPEQLKDEFDRKFLGKPREASGPKTDNTKGKQYRDSIESTYKSVGFDPKCVKRVWVCWTVRDPNVELSNKLNEYCEQHDLGRDMITVLSFRDLILPKLLVAVGTSNYQDDTLRTLSLLQQAQKQSLSK